MHKLGRTSITPPLCLASYDFNTQTWSNFSSACKSELRSALVQLQGRPSVTNESGTEFGVRCAYCEGAIYSGGHIEHFRRKNPAHSYAHLTFEWTNLFLACGSNTHCGHFKDRNGAPSYDPDQLIKPDEDDPEEYLYFYSSGEVRIREGIVAKDRNKASETIRVFGLDNSSLGGARAKALRLYKKKILDNLDEISKWSPDDRNEYLLDEIKETKWEPYSTTIKHFLQNKK